MWKAIIQIVLVIIIIVLGYFVYESVMGPVRFNQKKELREDAVIKRLKDIRSAQIAYKNLHDNYAASFDTLINFIKNDDIPVVKIVPDPEDTTFTKTINDTIAYIKVVDSLFSGRQNFKPSGLRYIPFSDNETFKLDAAQIEKGGLEVDVFEASAHYNTFLEGLNKQLIINLIKSRKDIDRFPGLKVGSMQEPSTDGNWE